jgi:uncharacterized membrane protein
MFKKFVFVISNVLYVVLAHDTILNHAHSVNSTILLMMVTILVIIVDYLTICEIITKLNK